MNNNTTNGGDGIIIVPPYYSGVFAHSEFMHSMPPMSTLRKFISCSIGCVLTLAVLYAIWYIFNALQ